jgi:hypothetical protein
VKTRYARGHKGLRPLTYVFQIYVTFVSQQFDEFLRAAYGINNLSKSLHLIPTAPGER